jgi:hypothetical protein
MMSAMDNWGNCERCGRGHGQHTCEHAAIVYKMADDGVLPIDTPASETEILRELSPDLLRRYILDHTGGDYTRGQIFWWCGRYNLQGQQISPTAAEIPHAGELLELMDSNSQPDD